MVNISIVKKKKAKAESGGGRGEEHGTPRALVLG